MGPTGMGRALLVGTAGLALAVGAVALADRGAEPAAGQAPTARAVTLSAAQLGINQRISRAAVRRSNEALELLFPIRPQRSLPGKTLGWGAESLRGGAVTGPKLGDGAVGPQKLAPQLADRQPRWAVVSTTGDLARGRGATGSERTGFGSYRVTFDRSVAGCALAATVAVAEPGDPVLIDRTPTLGIDAAEPQTVTVRMQVISAPANGEDAPFHLTAMC